MKEYGVGIITKAEADYNKWKDYLIDKEGDYVCSIPSCNKVWIPNENDINRKRPSCYYKLCAACRMKSFLKGREYKIKKGTNNYDKLYDKSNN
jgi:hypothetical protein